MKTITSIFAILLLFSGMSQELPKNNKKVLKFAEKRYKMLVPVRWHLGSKCRYLCLRAVQRANTPDGHWLRLGGDAIYGSQIKNKRDILPGDFILFNGLTYNNFDFENDQMTIDRANNYKEFWGREWSDEKRQKWYDKHNITISNHVGVVSDITWNGDVYTLTVIHQSPGVFGVMKWEFCSEDFKNEKFTIRRL